MLKGIGRIIIQDGERPKKVLVYIPQDIAKDSQFPFTESAVVNIVVDAENKRLIIERSRQPKES